MSDPTPTEPQLDPIERLVVEFLKTLDNPQLDTFLTIMKACAESEDAAVEAETERCANIAENSTVETPIKVPVEIAAAIRGEQ